MNSFLLQKAIEIEFGSFSEGEKLNELDFSLLLLEVGILL